MLEAMLPYLQDVYGNPSSLNRFSRISRSAINTAREQLAALIDAQPAQIIFTSGGTEANAMAISNAGKGNLAISAIEHPSVLVNAHARQQQVFEISVDKNGLVNPDSLDELPLQTGDFVSVMLANNETGAIQDVKAIVERLADRKITIHTDAVQALGKLPFSFKNLGAQLLTVSSHKIYGPKGCGALVFADKFPLKPLLGGGSQEQGLRAGTENVAAIVGFGKAAELANSELGARNKHILALKVRLEQQLLTIPDLVIFAKNTPRLPNTLQFGIPGIKGEMLLMQLDRKEIVVSSGSACAAASTASSPVLAAMGVETSLAESAIRISLGKDNNEQEIDQFVSVLKALLAIN